MKTGTIKFTIESKTASLGQNQASEAVRANPSPSSSVPTRALTVSLRVTARDRGRIHWAHIKTRVNQICLKVHAHLADEVIKYNKSDFNEVLFKIN